MQKEKELKNEIIMKMIVKDEEEDNEIKIKSDIDIDEPFDIVKLRVETIEQPVLQYVNMEEDNFDSTANQTAVIRHVDNDNDDVN